MDQSWRPRPPPIQGNNTICPTCSVYHFPFCPPPPHPNPYPFHENPRFQPLNENYMQRPRFDPFIDHRRPPPNLQRPLAGDPNDGFTGRRDWHTSPNLESRIPYGQSQTGEYDYRDGFEMNNHGGVGIKRMRVDELGSSMLGSSNIYANSSRNGYQGHERILKLIHDHGNGNAPGGLPRGGDNYETNRYVQGRSEEFQGFRDDYFDKNRGSFHADHYNVDSVKFIEERGPLFVENVRASDSSDRFAQSRYDPVEDSMPLSLQYGGHGGYLPSCFANTVETKQREDDSARYYEGSISYDSVSHNKLTQRSPMSQNVYYATSETRTENYHSFRGLPPSDNISVKELHYSRSINNQLPSRQAQQSQLPSTGDCYLSSLPTDPREPVNVPPQVDLQDSVGRQNSSPYSWPNLREERRYPSIPISNNVSPRHTSHLHNAQPPLPLSPPPPLPQDPGHNCVERLVIPPQQQPPKTSSSLFPIALSSRDDVPTLHTQDPRAHSLAQTYNANNHSVHASTGFATEDFRAHQSSRKYSDEGQPFRRKHPPLEKLHIVDATHIFKHPHRTTRPDRIVIILRGLPGSGKSYLAKMLRDLEVENGGTAPRIHSMDEYFMTEVEKVEESEVSKSSSSVRGKRSVMKTVMEYCYEPEMEEAYRSSMLKAFKKTLDEGDFSFVIVDDRNLRVADFAQFWAIAKRSGYEVYLLEAAYKDPVGCAARNVHGFTQDNIQEMARQWEEAPSLYLKLDIKSLLHGDDLEESGIKEVDMDMEDGDPVDGLQGSEFENAENAAVPPVEDFSSHDERKGHKQGSHLTEEVKELKSSKWSDDLDDDQAHGAEGRHGHSSALSGLIQAYSREGKSVRWSDQGGNIGFSIGAAKRANVLSLVIGPGSGYNLKSNPLPAGEILKSAHDGVKSKSQNIFQQRMRAEHESFKAVFDKRRQRIGGFGVEEE